MKNFQVFLTRDYIVDIQADSQREAAEYAEFFIAGGFDASTEDERRLRNFEIVRIKPVVNEAFEIHEIPENA